jgi:hypothetical protein
MHGCTLAAVARKPWHGWACMCQCVYITHDPIAGDGSSPPQCLDQSSLRRGPLPSPAAATARTQRACRPQAPGPLLLFTHFVHFYLRSKKLNLLNFDQIYIRKY